MKRQKPKLCLSTLHNKACLCAFTSMACLLSKQMTRYCVGKLSNRVEIIWLGVANLLLENRFIAAILNQSKLMSPNHLTQINYPLMSLKILFSEHTQYFVFVMKFIQCDIQVMCHILSNHYLCRSAHKTH